MAQQNLDFNIVAHTKGMEAIATMINRVGALEAETKRLAAANATLSSSTDTVIRNGVRYNNAMDAQSKQLRQARQGTQQLGMQINDFATSVSSGSSVTQAFTQQLGQVGYAMSQMGGIAGKLGGFLAGPWGALVLVGAMALTPLIEKLYQTMVGANKAEGALAGLMKRRAQELAGKTEIADSEKGLAKLVNRRAELEATIAKKGRRDSQGRLMFVYAEQKALQEINAEIASARDAIDAARTTKLGLGLESVTRDLYRPVTQDKVKVGGGGGKTDAVRAAEKAAKEQEKIAEWVAEKNIAADQEWRKYWVDAEQSQMDGLQEKLSFMAEMADATVQTTTERLINPILAAQDNVRKSYEAVGMAVNDAFKGMLTGAMSWKDGMRGIIGAVIDELWRLYVVQQIVGFVTSLFKPGASASPSGASAFSKVASAAMAPGKLGPAFANGTVNAPGGMAWVGERGPELVNLPRGAQVIPAHRAQNMMGGGVTVNVDARGSADPAAVRAQVQAGIMQAAPAIIAAAEARTVQGLRRPRLGGVMQ